MLNYGQKFLQSLNKGAVGKFNPSPLSLFQNEQRGKLASFLSKNVAQDPASNFGAYFKGKNLVNAADPKDIVWGAANESLAATRKVGWGAAAGIAGASAVGLDPLGITSGAKNVAALGMHGAVGMGLYGMGGRSKLAGVAYLGMTAINTFRKGDNIGAM